MNIHIHRIDGQQSSVLKIKGEVDAFTAPKLKEELYSLTEKKHYEVVVDLAGVEYMDSTGLGVFIGALKSAQAHHTKLKFRNPTERVLRLFTITGLVEIMDIMNEGEAQHEKR